MSNKKAIPIPVTLPPKLLDTVDAIVADGTYGNRLELVRDAVRRRVEEIQKEQSGEAIKERMQEIANSKVPYTRPRTGRRSK